LHFCTCLIHNHNQIDRTQEKNTTYKEKQSKQYHDNSILLLLLLSINITITISSTLVVLLVVILIAVVLQPLGLAVDIAL